jgi:hypothetical protein
LYLARSPSALGLHKLGEPFLGLNISQGHPRVALDMNDLRIASGAQTCGLPACRRPEQPNLPGAYSASRSITNLIVLSVSGPPAGPHVVGDCARKLTSLYTLSSVLRPAGHAAVRWRNEKIEDSSELQEVVRLENPIRQVKGNLRFPLTVTYHGCPRSLLCWSTN